MKILVKMPKNNVRWVTSQQLASVGEGRFPPQEPHLPQQSGRIEPPKKIFRGTRVALACQCVFIKLLSQVVNSYNPKFPHKCELANYSQF